MQTSITSFIDNHPPLLPVVTLESEATVMHLSDALSTGGIKAVEITLRSQAGLKALQQLKDTRPDFFLCAGSVVSETQLIQVAKLGVDLVVTPGISRRLLEKAAELHISILPGVSTASEIMLGLEYQLKYFKFFPAETLGGLDYLKSISEPFADIQFCPTGGINADNMRKYINSKKVAFLGGSWLAPKTLIHNRDWQSIQLNTECALNLLVAKP